jgi:hypothetical protein
VKTGLQVSSFTWPGGPAVIGPTLAAIARTADDAGFALATGPYAAADLTAHQPDVLLESLADTDRAVAAILG